MTNSTYEQTAAGQGEMGGGRLTVQPCMSPHSPPPPLLFFLSVFLSVLLYFCLTFFLSPSFWWQLSLMKSLHGIISTTSLHIFSMGGSSGKKKYFRHWHQSRVLPTELVPNREEVAAAKRSLLNVNVIFQRAAWSEMRSLLWDKRLPTKWTVFVIMPRWVRRAKPTVWKFV